MENLNKLASARRYRLSGSKMTPYVFILPFIISFIIFFMYPAIYSLILSFYRYKGYGSATFVGLENYIKLVKYPVLWKELLNTLFYFVIHFIPVMLMSFLLALAIKSKMIKKFRTIYKPIIFMPQMVASVAAALIFKIIFGGEAGVINQLLGTNIPFLTNLDLMRWPIVSLIIWRATGWYFVIYLSGLTTISEDVIEAATIDGASSFQRVIHIIIPIMKPIFMFAFVMDAISSLKIYNEPNLLTLVQGNTPTQVAPYMNVIVDNIQAGVFGTASAAGWLLFILILVITIFQFVLFRQGDEK